ncbi:MAG: ATP-binding protein [Myxococcales bacterium]|nr:ATP-binding protein [Myxococcales bacterium]
MFDRLLAPPKRSFFLFGPRATGKSTWLKQRFPDALRLDLLRNDVYFRLSAAPGELRSMVTAEPRSRWVVLDEVQRIPELLNEVHALIEDGGHRFALTGSSARRLKRGRANLLAGRALVRSLLPLVRAEYGDAATVEDVLRFGSLPVVLAEPESRVDILEAYAGTYLREEIKEEALTRNVPAYTRFLQVAAVANAQVTNLSAISRDTGVPRATVSTYFEILTDTLLGRFLPAWTARARMKEVAHPKFYFFDTGVVRALQGRLRDAPAPEERGHLFETYVFHELAAHVAYRNIGGEWSYWRTVDGIEVDFIWRRGDLTVAIECKSTDSWRARDDAGLAALSASKVAPMSCHGVYLGAARLRRDWGVVHPFGDFLAALHAGKVLPTS